MAKAITRRIDVLSLGRGRRKNCVELVRKAARGDLADDVWQALAGHRCAECGDGLLRMAEHVAFKDGPEAGLDIVETASVARLSAELKCRSLALQAYLCRHADSALALSLWREAVEMNASVREHADAWRRGAFPLAEASEFQEARSALLKARRLHGLADRVAPPVDAERYLGAVDVGVVYVEVSAYYLGQAADLRRAVRAGVRVLNTIDYGDAPRTWLAGLANLLAAVVCAWRVGLSLDVRPAEVASLADAAQRAVPRTSAAAVNLRWLRALALAETYGLTPQTLGMFERVRRALAAQGRFHDAVRVLLDVVWFDAYGFGGGSPDQTTWVERADQVLRYARRHGKLDLELLSQWRDACRHGVVEAPLMDRLMYDVRGLRVSAATVTLTPRAR